MKKCKNCGKEISEHRIYCSLTCRNIYVNKNIRDYSKNSNSLSMPYLEEYKNNPNFCKSCGKKIPYEKRRNKYCNHSCAAKDVNKNRKCKSFNLSEEGMNNLRKANKQMIKKRDYDKKKEYYSNIKRCPNCNKMITFRKRKNIFCDINCKKDFYKDQRTELENYKLDCKFKFNLKDYPNEFEFMLIEKYGWYKPKNRGDNLGGVSRDHMYSIVEGFKNNINPEIISHPANCKLMVHTKNISKNSNSSITIENLNERIENWNKNYIAW